MTLQTTSDGFAVAVNMTSNTTTTAWTNATERYDQVVEGALSHSGASIATTGSPLIITATYTGGATKRPLVGASW